MRIINLEGAAWSTRTDFFRALLLALGAPDDHARNMYALMDSIGGDNVNQARLPYAIEVAGVSQ